jgi:hypothetical protein
MPMAGVATLAASRMSHLGYFVEKCGENPSVKQQAALTSRLMGPNAFKRTHCCCHLNSAGALLGFFEIRYKFAIKRKGAGCSSNRGPVFSRVSGRRAMATPSRHRFQLDQLLPLPRCDRSKRSPLSLSMNFCASAASLKQ